MTNTTIDPNVLRILKVIRRFAPVSRTQLPKLTGLSSGLVSRLTGHLLERGFISELREDVGPGRGRPRTYLSINGEGAIAVGVGVDVDGTLTATFVGLDAKELFSTRLPLEQATNLETLALNLANAIRDIIDRSPFSRDQIAGLGVALPAIVDPLRGIVYFATTLPEGPVSVGEIVARELSMPVTIENDMVCMARAEHWFGRTQSLDNFTLVAVDLSMGAARYRDGMPMVGANAISSELGHTKIAFGPDARPCFCGARGCASSYASLFVFIQDLVLDQGLTIPSKELINARFEAIKDGFDAGDAAARSAVVTVGEHLGLVVANVINANDPGHVIVTLPDERFLRQISSAFHQTLDACVLPGLRAITRVELCVARQDWRQTGTAALALEKVYLSTSRQLASAQAGPHA